MDQPKTTLTFYEEIGPEDTPWLTICPIPGFDLIKLDSLIKSSTTDNDHNQLQLKSVRNRFLNLPLAWIMSVDIIRTLSLISNVSVNNLLSETVLPLRNYSAHKFSCEFMLDASMTTSSCELQIYKYGKTLVSYWNQQNFRRKYEYISIWSTYFLYRFTLFSMEYYKTYHWEKFDEFRWTFRDEYFPYGWIPTIRNSL
jgi:hypothetical protein